MSCFLSARVSRFVSDKEQCSVLISLLLPYLQKGTNPQVRLTNYYFCALRAQMRLVMNVLMLGSGPLSELLGSQF